MGILPGVGEDMAAWSSYAAAKAASKEKEQFGKGSIEGLMAAETGDKASIPGDIIPALALGIPGSAPSAVLMAAMIIHGVQPGPMLMIEPAALRLRRGGHDHAGVDHHPAVRPVRRAAAAARAARARADLMPIVFLLCTVGAFAIASRLFDVYVDAGIGIAMFLLRRRGYPMAPLVLGTRARADMLDKSLRRGLVLSDGEPDAVLHPADLRGARRE